MIYTFNGQARTQNVMDFSNPAVFKTVASWEGNPPAEEVEIEVGKNAGGYNEWRSIGNASAAGTSESSSQPTATSAAPRAGTYTAPVRDFENREERAARQVLIVKQSSLKEAVASLGPNQEIDAYLERAQAFTDWVLEGNDNV